MVKQKLRELGKKINAALHRAPQAQGAPPTPSPIEAVVSIAAALTPPPPPPPVETPIETTFIPHVETPVETSPPPTPPSPPPSEEEKINEFIKSASADAVIEKVLGVPRLPGDAITLAKLLDSPIFLKFLCLKLVGLKLT